MARQGSRNNSCGWRWGARTARWETPRALRGLRAVAGACSLALAVTAFSVNQSVLLTINGCLRDRGRVNRHGPAPVSRVGKGNPEPSRVEAIDGNPALTAARRRSYPRSSLCFRPGLARKENRALPRPLSGCPLSGAIPPGTTRGAGPAPDRAPTGGGADPMAGAATTGAMARTSVGAIPVGAAVRTSVRATAPGQFP
jgi:hypothetical protein